MTTETQTTPKKGPEAVIITITSASRISGPERATCVVGGLLWYVVLNRDGEERTVRIDSWLPKSGGTPGARVVVEAQEEVTVPPGEIGIIRQRINPRGQDLGLSAKKKRVTYKYTIRATGKKQLDPDVDITMPPGSGSS